MNKNQARWWHNERKKVACDLCPKKCRIAEGERGFCFVRQNVDGQMVLTTYGRSTGFCVDPIEKKPLNHFLPGTAILSFGTAGCNLGCKFCQNWDTSKSKQMEVMCEEAPPEAIVRAAKNCGCRSIAFTYNDPIVWAEYAIDTAIAAHQLDLKTVAVTSGYINPEPRTEFYEHIDAANVDLKAFSEVFYKHLTLGSLKPVLDTLKWLKQSTKVWFEITNLLIPEENDAPQEIEDMCKWILDNLGADVPLHFSAFHPDYKLLDKPRTPHSTLVRAREQALMLGLRYVYLGNVLDRDRQSTYCPNCNSLLIDRDHYELGAYEIRDGKCPQCSASIPGVFENQRGDWGARRMPVRISDYEDDAAFLQASDKSPTENAEKQISHAQQALSEASAAVERLVVEVAGEEALGGISQNRTKTDFSDSEVQRLLAFARTIVQSTVTNNPQIVELDQALAETPAYGVFVTLQRGGLLRACRGHWGDDKVASLGALVHSAAVSTAAMDVRFPSITPEELPFLTLEISLMHDPQILRAKGHERIKAIQIGTHGLVISHPQGRGLLLPHVASENGWNEQIFFERLCAKAGLPNQAWLDDQSEILTFRTRLLISPPSLPELLCEQLHPSVPQQLVDIANYLVRRENIEIKVNASLAEVHQELIGIAIENAAGATASVLLAGVSLIDLVKRVVDSIGRQSAERKLPAAPITRLIILSQPILLRPEDYPARHGTLHRNALMIQHQSQGRVILPSPAVPVDKVAAALSSFKLTAQDWKTKGVQMTAFSVFSISGPAVPESRSRRAVFAGSFYPGEPKRITEALQLFLRESEGQPKLPYRGVILPHAGWRFCGDVIGRVLAGVQVPNLVVVLGPKHTRFGSHWSVSAHDSWSYPHAVIPVDLAAAMRLAEMVPGLALEDDAHREEHSIEVLLPFLHYLNPQVRVIPIAVGHSSYDSLNKLSAGLFELAKEKAEPMLIVASSDMNHFAEDQENQRLDHLALDALCTGKPEQLYKTCSENRISMCGIMPALAMMNTLLQSSGEIKPRVVDYHTSAKTSGDASRVVGYAGVVIE